MTGTMASLRVSVGYVYLMELLPKKAKTFVTTIWCVQEAFIYVFATIYFWVISKHWFYFGLIGYFFCIGSVTLLFFMPESPAFLINVGKIERANMIFAKIAKINGKEFDLDISSIGKVNTETSEKTADVSMIEDLKPVSWYLKQRKVMINLILMSFVWLTTSFGYYLIMMLTNTFDNVYASALVSSISEIVAYIISGLFYDKIGVKLSLILSFAISFIGGILILAWGL